MMGDREPALLVVLIQPACACWHVGGIRSSSEAIPLLRSEADHLIDCQGLEFEAQLSCLRHHFAGVLQRGCDRMFARKLKASHFLLVADGHFLHASQALTQRLAEHFVQWMMNPPVSYLLGPQGFVSRSPGGLQLSDFQLIAGTFPNPVADALIEGLPELVAKLHESGCWELVVPPRHCP